MRIYTALLLACFLVPVYYVTNENVRHDLWWHFSDARINKKRPWVNEKISKINLLFDSKSKFDCLIMGSSRATLMHTSKINGARCFNLAFSATLGQVKELIYYQSYYNYYFNPPDTLVVEVGEFNFQAPGSDSVPEFIYSKRRPSSWIHDYVSLHTLSQTRKILNPKSQQMNRPRMYDEKFEVIQNTKRQWDIKKVALRYQTSAPNCAAITENTKAINQENVKYYRTLAAQQPGRIYGYTAPISLDRLLSLYQTDQLENYLAAIHSTSTYFDRYYDFSIPYWFAEYGKTYDGSHFSPEDNELIGEILFENRASDIYGLNLKQMAFEEYREKFYDAMKKIAIKYNINVASCSSGVPLV